MTIQPVTIEHKNKQTKFNYSELRTVWEWLCTQYPELDCKRWHYNTETCEAFLADHANMKPGKAYAKYLYERFSLKISESHKAEIGQKIKGTTNEQTIIFKVTLGCEGEASEYYHRSSCYWGEYSMSRDYIESNHGGAVRAYVDNRIIGRVWFLPYNGENLKDGMILFNAYGKDELQHIHKWGEMLAQALHKQHCKTYLDLSYDGEFYLNSHNTQFVGEVLKFQEETDVRINLHEPDTLVYSDGL